MNTVHSSRLLRALFVSAGLLVSGGFVYGQTINLQGEVEQNADLDTSPVSALAIGSNAEANAGVNVIEGSVSIAGKVTQKAKLDTSPVSALAIGAGSKASARVNAIIGR